MRLTKKMSFFEAGGKKKDEPSVGISVCRESGQNIMVTQNGEFIAFQPLVYQKKKKKKLY